MSALQGPIPAAGAPHETTLRVRYEETDRMGVVYHGKYFEYFEVGRTEWLRARGLVYRDLEEKGFGLVVSEVAARYRAPARYDDLITIRTTLVSASRITLDFRYEVLRDGAEGSAPASAGRASGIPPGASANLAGAEPGRASASASGPSNVASSAGGVAVDSPPDLGGSGAPARREVPVSAPAASPALLAEGTTRLVSVGPDGRPRRMLPELAALVASVRRAADEARAD